MRERERGTEIEGNGTILRESEGEREMGERDGGERKRERHGLFFLSFFIVDVG